MRLFHIALAAAAALPAAAGPAAAQQSGRYQVTAVPGAAGGQPTVVMLDTATGQSWTLVQTPGPPVQWAPLRFWTPGNPPTLSPLPSPPAAVGRDTLHGAARDPSGHDLRTRRRGNNQGENDG